MTVRTRPTLTGMLAIAAAGIFAAGTIADRANTVFAEVEADLPPLTPARYALATECDADAACPEPN